MMLYLPHIILVIVLLHCYAESDEVVCNDDTTNTIHDDNNIRVPNDCKLVMAPSDVGGWGVIYFISL